MSPDKAAHSPHLGAAEDDPMESPPLSPGSMFADLLRTGGDLSGEPYPCAKEGAGESGQEKEATCLAGSGRGRLHTSTGHARHVPGPYLMKFLSPTDPLTRPPSLGSILGQEPAPGTPTADPPAGSHHSPLEGSNPHRHPHDSGLSSTRLHGTASRPPGRIPSLRLLHHPCRTWSRNGGPWPWLSHSQMRTLSTGIS